MDETPMDHITGLFYIQQLTHGMDKSSAIENYPIVLNLDPSLANYPYGNVIGA